MIHVLQNLLASLSNELVLGEIVSCTSDEDSTSHRDSRTEDNALSVTVVIVE